MPEYMDELSRKDSVFLRNDVSAVELMPVLKKWGVVAVPRYVDGGLLLGIEEEFEALFALKSKEIHVQQLPVYRSIRIPRHCVKQDRFPLTASVFENSLLKTIAHSYFSDLKRFYYEIHLQHDYVGFNDFYNYLHFDVIHTLKFFLYLTDTTTQNGAFHCIPGTQRISALKRDAIGNPYIYKNRKLTLDLPLSKDQAIPIEGQAGTLLIFDSDIFHCAGEVLEGERKIMRTHSR